MTDLLNMCARVLLVWILMAMAAQCHGNEIANLNESAKVMVSAKLASNQPVALHQQVVVTVEVATDTWFTKGTKVHRFEVENALVATRSAFAVNSTQRRNGKTYAVQQWDIVLYPLATGELLIPSIVVELQVKSEQSNISGYLTTTPIKFEVIKPSAFMNPDNSWLVSPDVTLEQTWQRISSLSDETELLVGDALIREVSIEALQTSIMFMPDRLIKEGANNGYQRYRQQITLSDSENRGLHIARFKRQYTYVFEQPGRYTLPTIELYQWHPDTNQMHVLKLAPKEVVIKHTLVSYVRSYWQWIMTVLIGLVLSLCALITLWKRYQCAKRQQKLPLFWLYLLAVVGMEEVELEVLLFKKRHSQGHYQFMSISADTQYHRLIARIQVKRYASTGGLMVTTLSRFEWLWLWWMVSNGLRTRLVRV
ncbi:BatD family protein [Vibrio sp. ZSDZ65]|uniref:BatD family protein n=1 Tax=Vibrio qingdaonensis TaxID=2829491 RepID=A0A9X3HX17_9VIBR|nr:BatD family protein [Vibrio qingdaonensis]MCW8346357.1 BatD family protein [Vibrio qingdaonensis]